MYLSKYEKIFNRNYILKIPNPDKQNIFIIINTSVCLLFYHCSVQYLDACLAKKKSSRFLLKKPQLAVLDDTGEDMTKGCYCGNIIVYLLSW